MNPRTQLFATFGFFVGVLILCYFLIFSGGSSKVPLQDPHEVDSVVYKTLEVKQDANLPYVLKKNFINKNIYSSLINYYKIIFKHSKIQKNIFAIIIENVSEAPIQVFMNVDIEEAAYPNEAIATIEAKSIDTLSVSPQFISSYLSNLTEKQFKKLKIDISIKHQDSLYSAYNDVVPITLLPSNIMKYYVKDIQTDKVVDTRPLLAGYVDPAFFEVDELLRVASKENGGAMLVGYQDITAKTKRETVNDQMKALFNALRKVPVTYVSNPVDYSGDQKIKSSSEILKYESANCIEGVIIYASVIEALGMEPLIVLVPGHAFIGWKSWRGQKTASFLETTMIWNVSDPSFETALEAGEQQFNTAKGEGYFNNGQGLVLDIVNLRGMGILPMSVDNSSF